MDQIKTIGMPEFFRDFLEKKMRTKRISIVLPEILIEHLKKEASGLGIGYKTLIEMKLMKEVQQDYTISWGKGKPTGSKIKPKQGKLVSEMILEERR